MKNFNEMDMALKIIGAIAELSPKDFVVEYNRLFGKNIDVTEVKWTGFPVYYDPED